jgi:hypothetical protein
VSASPFSIVPALVVSATLVIAGVASAPLVDAARAGANELTAGAGR